ncbi:hypothetical protein E2C01_069459 [Portunus trituberculatus]|uniref:Uncharacterized protein n=1 Tax=Portunus trituberculatus TaxID=210409 RepID=A0A5B7HYY1_PORTR|nr:hypothetical protein [Portunus trituberculatus]
MGLRGYFLRYLLSQSPPARKPLPRVRKPSLHSDRGQDSNPCAWRPSDPKARMVSCDCLAAVVSHGLLCKKVEVMLNRAVFTSHRAV